jgi:hypothetical protein
MEGNGKRKNKNGRKGEQNDERTVDINDTERKKKKAKYDGRGRLRKKGRHEIRKELQDYIQQRKK